MNWFYVAVSFILHKSEGLPTMEWILYPVCFYLTHLVSVSKSCLANWMVCGYSKRYRLQCEVTKHSSLRRNIHMRRPAYNVYGKWI